MKYLIALAALLLARPAFADPGIQRTPCGFQQLTLGATAQSLTIPPACQTPGGPYLLVMRVEGSGLSGRYRDDGVAPTASVGMLINQTDTYPYEYSGNGATLQFISTSGAPVLDVLFYR